MINNVYLSQGVTKEVKKKSMLLVQISWICDVFIITVYAVPSCCWF